MTLVSISNCSAKFQNRDRRYYFWRYPSSPHLLARITPSFSQPSPYLHLFRSDGCSSLSTCMLSQGGERTDRLLSSPPLAAGCPAVTRTLLHRARGESDSMSMTENACFTLSSSTPVLNRDIYFLDVISLASTIETNSYISLTDFCPHKCITVATMITYFILYRYRFFSQTFLRF